MWSIGIKIAFFFKKLRSGRGLRPQTPLAFGGWGLRPQTPLCDTFQLQYTSSLKHVSKFRHFRILSIGLKGHSGRFCLKNFFAKPKWNNFGNFLEFFRAIFDSLRPRNRKIFEIIFPLRLRRNAFRTLPNWKDVRQNRSKWLTALAAVEELSSEVPADNRNKPKRKMLTKMLCTEVCNFIFTWKTNWPYLIFRLKPIAQ